MGWFDTALSVATTIGKVAGALSGGGQDLVHLGPLGEDGIGDVVFWNAAGSGETQALNKSVASGVQIYFPGSGTSTAAAATSILIPAGSKANVSPAFVTYSDADVDDMSITPGVVALSGADDPGTGGGAATIQAQTAQTVQPGIQVQLGPYFTLKVDAPNNTILVGVGGTLALGAVTLLNVRGAGRTAARIINAVRKAQEADDDPQHITIDLPAGIDITNGLTSVELIASVTGLDEEVARFGAENPGLVERITDADYERLAAFAAGRG